MSIRHCPSINIHCGLCRSLELEEWDMGDPQECLEECQALSGCEVSFKKYLNKIGYDIS